MPEGGQAREEHVCRDLQARRRQGEEIIGREGRQGEDEEHEGVGEEDRESPDAGRGEGPDRLVCGFR